MWIEDEVMEVGVAYNGQQSGRNCAEYQESFHNGVRLLF